MHGRSPKFRAQVRDLFEHEHGPIHACVISIHYSVKLRRLHVIGEFRTTDRDLMLGMFSRSIWEEDGRLQVYNQSCHLQEEWCNRGLGAEWFRECERRCRTFGVQHIYVRAMHKGGYVWAREGFVFCDKDVPKLFWKLRQGHLDLLVDEGKVSRRQIASWRRRICHGELDTPQRVAALGCRNTWREGDFTMWSGKSLLLDQPSWRGMKAL